jgi:hypothetical protein
MADHLVEMDLIPLSLQHSLAADQGKQSWDLLYL